MKRMRWRCWLPALAAALCATAAQGACLSGRPALADEFAQATTVVVAHVQSARDVQDDPEDPAGISATLYTARVAERLRGAAPALLELRSDNTASRFHMEPGRRYLLFVHRARDAGVGQQACAVGAQAGLGFWNLMRPVRVKQ